MERILSWLAIPYSSLPLRTQHTSVMSSLGWANQARSTKPCSQTTFLFKDFSITLSGSEDLCFPALVVLLAASDCMGHSNMAWVLEEGTSPYSWCVCAWAAQSGNPTSSQKQALEVPAQPNILKSLQIAFISQTQRTNSFTVCSILTLFYFFFPILGQCEGRCALTFAGFNQARFDSISY